jgi:hypothetical protein
VPTGRTVCCRRRNSERKSCGRARRRQRYRRPSVHRNLLSQIPVRPPSLLGHPQGVVLYPLRVLSQERLERLGSDVVLIQKLTHPISVHDRQIPSKEHPVETAQHTLDLGLMSGEEVVHQTTIPRAPAGTLWLRPKAALGRTKGAMAMSAPNPGSDRGCFVLVEGHCVRSGRGGDYGTRRQGKRVGASAFSRRREGLHGSVKGRLGGSRQDGIEPAEGGS